MSLFSRIGKLEKKIAQKEKKVYLIGWADCTWSKSEGLIRHENESIKDFRKRVLSFSIKQYIWVR